jgi:hypothetical protein
MIMMEIIKIIMNQKICNSFKLNLLYDIIMIKMMIRRMIGMIKKMELLDMLMVMIKMVMINKVMITKEEIEMVVIDTEIVKVMLIRLEDKELEELECQKMVLLAEIHL